MWEILPVNDARGVLDPHKCKIKYKTTMSFSNPLYASVTKQFFDALCGVMHQKFADRCKELYYSNEKQQIKEKEVFIPKTSKSLS